MLPGHIDHAYSQVISGLNQTDPEVRIAGETIHLTVEAKDLYGNLRSNGSDKDALTVNAVYVNHSAYISPIGVGDLERWEDIWGKNITGELIEKPDHPGQYEAFISIFRAGMYAFHVRVFGEDILGFPKNFDIAPNPSIYAPKSIISGLNTSEPLVAGNPLTFQIQARDYYSNNLATLASALSSKNVTLTTNGAQIEGTITDKLN